VCNLQLFLQILSAQGIRGGVNFLFVNSQVGPLSACAPTLFPCPNFSTLWRGLVILMPSLWQKKVCRYNSFWFSHLQEKFSWFAIRFSHLWEIFFGQWLWLLVICVLFNWRSYDHQFTNLLLPFLCWSWLAIKYFPICAGKFLHAMVMPNFVDLSLA